MRKGDEQIEKEDQMENPITRVFMAPDSCTSGLTVNNKEEEEEDDTESDEDREKSAKIVWLLTGGLWNSEHIEIKHYKYVAKEEDLLGHGPSFIQK
ncbi:hypothetical protein Dsin_024061 [Dipteronia sinensis]|uniref:Uncharacterized protein n=1 Tax=Dipteronia sinensis TaxID=43782 RepID=A0AAE0A631_9ROSI|nr:hypothetical protein Dsin_024061 [Dipteronia sinensis]